MTGNHEFIVGKQIAMSIGKSIKLFRELQEKTLKSVSEEVGISESYLSLIERDARPVPEGRLIDLEKALNLPQGVLTGKHKASLNQDRREKFLTSIEKLREAEGELRDWLKSSASK